MSVSLNGTTQTESKASAIVSALPMTFACWGNSTSATTNQVLVAQYNSGSTGVIMDLSTTGTVRAFVNSGTVAATTTSITVNTWFHACATYASGGSAVYLNGGSKGTATITSIGTPTATYIGSKTATSLFFSGQMAFVAIWNAQLIDAEVSALAGGADPRRVHPQSLVEYVPMVFSGALGFSYTNSTAWTLAGAPGLGATNPSMYMARGRSPGIFFATQNANITFSPVVTLNPLTATTGQQGGPPYEFWGGGHR